VSEEPKCAAHGYRRCTWCSLNPANCVDRLGRGGCSTYAEDGMHWDTCPNRVTGLKKAVALGIDLVNLLGEGRPKGLDSLRQPNAGFAAPREDALAEASRLITGDRNQTYGTPTQNFTDTANVWNTILRRKLKDGERIEPGEVAAMMVGLKLVRMVAQPRRDNWVDIAGYAGCGYEADVTSGRISD